MRTDINPSQIPKLIPLGKLMGLPLRQTLTVVWHSGQFFDLPRLERGGWIWLGSLSPPRFGTLRNHVPLVSNLTFFQANRFFSVTCPKLPQGLVSRLHVGETFKVLSDFFFWWHAMERISQKFRSWWNRGSKVALEEEWGDWLVSQRQAWFRKGYDGMMSVIQHGRWEFPGQMEVWTGRDIYIYYYYYLLLLLSMYHI
jgi:hypothetical protein